MLVRSDAGGYKPLESYPAQVIEKSETQIVVRKRAGASDDRLESSIAEVLSDVTHDMGQPEQQLGTEKDGVEADLQRLLAEQPHWCGEGLRLVRRGMADRRGTGRSDVSRSRRAVGGC